MLLSFLAIVSIGTVLAAEMLLDEQGVHRTGGIDGQADECHLGHLFHHYGVVDSIVGIFAPREGWK